MYGTYQRLNVRVSATPREVIKAASLKLKPDARRCHKLRKERHKFYRQMLGYHAKALKLYREWHF